MARHLPFTEMWDLILKNHTVNVAVFPPELLVAIFWEETAFRNMRQQTRCRNAPHHPNPNQRCAVGFGQIVPRFAIHPAVSGKSEDEIERLILADNSLSVQVTSTTLSENLRQRGHRIAALNQYASRPRTALQQERFRDATDESREAINKVDEWLRCERMLLTIRSGPGLPRSASSLEFRDAAFVSRIKDALRPMTIKRGISPDLAFPATAPPTSPRAEQHP